MAKYFFIFLILFSLTTCSDRSDTTKKEQSLQVTKADSTTLHSLLQDTTFVKKWITETIESYLNAEDLNAGFTKMQNSLTKDYYRYKQDAINREYDSEEGSLSEEAFREKWSKKYNTKLVGSGGFFISAQDNGKIKVITCNLLSNHKETTPLYHVVIEDQNLKTKFIRDFKIIELDNKLLIDDVFEYD